MGKVCSTKITSLSVRSQEEYIMAKTYSRNIPGSRVPILFIDLQGSEVLPQAAESMGKLAVRTNGEEWTTLMQRGLQKDTLYYTACSDLDAFVRLQEAKRAGSACRIGVNLPERLRHLVDEFICQEVTMLLAAERDEDDWRKHFMRATQFQTYIDPVFQPQVVERYRRMNQLQEEPPEQQLELDVHKARGTLSEAEIRILEKILEGKSNRKIAEECFLAVATVNNHVSHLTKKMQANDRTHTIKRAIEENWVEFIT